jgi:copper chaperone
MTQTFEVLNLKCSGCANTITKSLSSNFNDLEIDTEKKTVTVDIQNAQDEENLKSSLRALGYPLKSENLGFVTDKTLKAQSFVSCAIGKFSL